MQTRKKKPHLPEKWNVRNESEILSQLAKKELESGDLDVVLTQERLWCSPTTFHKGSLSDVFTCGLFLSLASCTGLGIRSTGTISASKHSWNVPSCSVSCHVQTWRNISKPSIPNDHFTVSVTGSCWLLLAEPESFAWLDFSKSEHLDLTLTG
jgi:hypothetical protein